MTPFSFEWQWSIEYLIFMGLFYLVLAIVGAGLIYAYIKTWIDLDDEGGKRMPRKPSRSRYTDY